MLLSLPTRPPSPLHNHLPGSPASGAGRGAARALRPPALSLLVAAMAVGGFGLGNPGHAQTAPAAPAAASPAAAPAPSPEAAPASAAVSGTEPTTLQRITVRGAQDPTRTEDTGSYTTRASTTATRLELSPRETPQSVSVLTRQQIEDQGLLSLEDMPNAVTGLSLSRGATERGSLQSRGFGISYYTADGLPMAASGDTLGFATLAMYDRVEVLRGAAGMMVGAGNPSGTVNLARKRPTAERRVSLSGLLGRWSDRRVEVDATGALNASGSVRGRAVLAWQDSDTFIPNYSHERRLAYATVDADFTPWLEGSIALSHNVEHNPGSSWYGLSTVPDGAFLPGRDLTNAPDWTYWDKINTRAFGELVFKAANGWRTRLAAQVLKDQLDSRVHGIGRVAPGGDTMEIISANVFTYDRYQRAFELLSSGSFGAFGRRHDAVLGASYRTLDQHDRGWRDPAYTPAGGNYRFAFDPVHWDTGAVPFPDISEFYYGQRTRQTQQALHATTRLRVAEPLALLAGLRYDKFKVEPTINLFSGTASASYAVEELTPYAGVVWDWAQHWSAYASWTRVFNPQSARNRSDELLPPVTGTNVEAGIKGELLDGQLNLAAAVFDIRQSHLAVSVDEPLTNCAPGMQSCSDAAGEVQSRGYELEASGALTPDWQISAGYTQLSAKYKRGTNTGTAATGVRYSTQFPTRVLKLGTSHRFGDFRVGGGLRVQNEVFRTNSPVRQGGYAIFDLNGGWQITPRFDLQAGIRNLFDKAYYQSIGTIDSGNSLGEPRNAWIRARYVFG